MSALRTVGAALILALAGIWLAFALLAVGPAPTYLGWQLSVLATELGHMIALVGLLFVPAWRGGRVLRAAALIGWTGGLLLLSPLARAIPVLRAVAAVDPPGLDHSYRLVPGGLEETAPRRVVYARRDSIDLPLDYYAPTPGARDAPAPLVVVIHGGSWAGGDPTQLPALNHVLASRGYAVAAIGYRLTPRSHYPAQLDDVRAALAWLRANAPELGLDPERIVLLGRSAGGHLALLTAYTTPGTGIRGAIGFYAPTDLIWGWENPANPNVIDSRGVLDRFVGGTPAVRGAEYRAASPISHVATATPTLLFHGTRDELVSVRNQQRLAAALAAAGRPARTVEMPWATHGCDYALSGPCGQITTRATLQFLADVMGE